MDKISKEKRSRNMAAIKSKNTTPELLLRKKLFLEGFRYRVHYKIDKFNLDIVFKSKNKAIDVNGCFWHQHENCNEASKPKTNSEFWKGKLKRNVERDKAKKCHLDRKGWKLLVVWECEIEKRIDETFLRVTEFLNSV